MTFGDAFGLSKNPHFRCTGYLIMGRVGRSGCRCTRSFWGDAMTTGAEMA